MWLALVSVFAGLVVFFRYRALLFTTFDPDVAQACVVPVPDEIKYQLPVAFVVPRPGTRPTEDALRRFALDNGPAYAHPRAIWLVNELPLAGTNKIDRKVLVDRAVAAYAREAGRRV